MWSKRENAVDESTASRSLISQISLNFLVEKIKLLRKTAVTLLPSNQHHHVKWQRKLTGFVIWVKSYIVILKLSTFQNKAKHRVHFIETPCTIRYNYSNNKKDVYTRLFCPLMWILIILCLQKLEIR